MCKVYFQTVTCCYVLTYMIPSALMLRFIIMNLAMWQKIICATWGIISCLLLQFIHPFHFSVNFVFFSFLCFFFIYLFFLEVEALITIMTFVYKTIYICLCMHLKIHHPLLQTPTFVIHQIKYLIYCRHVHNIILMFYYFLRWCQAFLFYFSVRFMLWLLSFSFSLLIYFFLDKK